MFSHPFLTESLPTQGRLQCPNRATANTAMFLHSQLLGTAAARRLVHEPPHQLRCHQLPLLP